MAADVAGFSAAMERDEEGTFAQVQELRRKIIEPKIAEQQPVSENQPRRPTTPGISPRYPAVLPSATWHETGAIAMPSTM